MNTENTEHQAPKQQQRRMPPKTGMLEEVFTLDEGAVTLTFPASLSNQSYQDLADHLEIFLRKAKRRAERGDE